MTYQGTAIGIVYLEKYDIPISTVKILYIKSIIPALITKKTKIKDVNLMQVLFPGKGSKILTKREKEILVNISDGLSNQDISEKLNISLGTTKKHISNIMIKLDADNRVQVLVKAKNLNLI